MTLYPAVLLYKKLSTPNFWTRSTMKMKLGLVQIIFRVLNVRGCACSLPHTQSPGHLLNVGGCALPSSHTQSLGHLAVPLPPAFLPISACDLLHIAFSLHISQYNYFIINCQELLGGYEESEFEDFFSGLWSTFKDKYLHKQVGTDYLYCSARTLIIFI